MVGFPRSVSSAARFTMPETQFPSVIQRIIDCQIGSSIRFFGSDPAAPGTEIQWNYNVFIQESKGGSSKDIK